MTIFVEEMAVEPKSVTVVLEEPMKDGIKSLSTTTSWISDEKLKLKKEDEFNTATFTGSLFNLANAALGAGLLTFPFSFAQTGLLGGIVIILILTVLVIIGLIAHAEAGKLTDSDTAALASRRLVGAKFELLCIAIVLTVSWLSCIIYLQIAGGQIEAFAYNLDLCFTPENGDPYLPWYSGKMFVTTTAGFLIVYPLCLMRSMSALAFASFLAVAACTYITIFMVVSRFSPLYVDASDIPHDDAVRDESDLVYLFRALPNMLFSFQCHLSCIPTYTATRRETRPLFPRICFCASLVCLILYTTAGVAGSTTFGLNTETSILDNFDKDDMGATTGKLLVAMAVLTSYPILSFCGRRELIGLLDRFAMHKKWNLTGNFFFGNEDRKVFVFGTFWFTSTISLALLIEKMGPVLGVAGNAAAFIMFLYPGVFMMKMANIAHPDTITQAIKDLPYAPDENSPDDWVYGLRENRVTYINKWQQALMWWSGVLFSILGVLTAIGGLTIVLYDIVTVKPSLESNICIQ